MMRDYDRLTLLFTADGTPRIPDADVEPTGQEEEIRAVRQRLLPASTPSGNTQRPDRLRR